MDGEFIRKLASKMGITSPKVLRYGSGFVYFKKFLCSKVCSLWFLAYARCEMIQFDLHVIVFSGGKLGVY